MFTSRTAIRPRHVACLRTHPDHTAIQPSGGTPLTDMGNQDSLSVDNGPGGVIVVHGDIDVAGGPILEAAILDRESDGPIVIDLGDVYFIDSSGLRSLLGASRRARARGATSFCATSGPRCCVSSRSPAPPSTSPSRPVVSEPWSSDRFSSTAAGPGVVARSSPGRQRNRRHGRLHRRRDRRHQDRGQRSAARAHRARRRSVDRGRVRHRGTFVHRARTHPVTTFDVDHPDLILCRTVLASVCTSHGIELVDHQAHIWAAVAHASIT